MFGEEGESDADGLVGILGPEFVTGVVSGVAVTASEASCEVEVLVMGASAWVVFSSASGVSGWECSAEGVGAVAAEGEAISDRDASADDRGTSIT